MGEKIQISTSLEHWQIYITALNSTLISENGHKTDNSVEEFTQNTSNTLDYLHPLPV